MPETTPQTPEQAYDVLVTQIHAPIFFEKLAQVYGVRPQNEDDARELLLIASELRYAHEQDKEKQAAAANSVLRNAHQDLVTVLQKQGYRTINDPTSVPSMPDANVKQAAAQVIQTRADIRSAALAWASHRASQAA